MRMTIPQRTFRRFPFWLIPLAIAVVVLFLPAMGANNSTLRVIVSVALLSMITVGLNLTFGFGGELALGQSFLYATGAYAAGYFATIGFDLPLTLIIAIAAAAMVGLLTGIPGLRLGSWSLAMLTFFLVLLIPDITNLLPTITGGAVGLTGIPLPSLFGVGLDSDGYYTLVVIVAVIVFAAFRNYVGSRNGTALRIIRDSPILARSIGLSVYRTKLTAYVIGALPAGIAGCLFAYQDGYISPVSFGFAASISILAASIIGGPASIYGAVFGAAVMVIGPLRSASFQSFSLVFFGVVLVVGGLFFTGGLAGVLNRLIRRNLVGDDLLGDVIAAAASTDRLVLQADGERLHVDSVSKSFGGNRALSEVVIDLPAGRILGLIGPNGSGKTTLLNIISGFYAPTSGSVRLGERDLTKLRSHQVARAGVSRTFQTPVIPKQMSVVDVVASARIKRSRVSILTSMLRLPKHFRVAREDRAEALQILATLGIAELADREASDLALGTTRLVEVARALAGSPSLVLLDEPASGLDEAEVQVLAGVIVRLRDAGATVVLVEHNFEMVMGIADTVTVLHLGKVIASGVPADVRDDPAVVESYLGRAARERMEAARRAPE